MDDHDESIQFGQRLMEYDLAERFDNTRTPQREAT